MRALRALLILCSFASASFMTAPILALPIVDLFNTGVATDDSDGMGAVLLTPGMPDPHYALISSPTLGDVSTVLSNHTLWVVNGPDSNWIGSIASLGDGMTDVPFGDYVYQSTFTLPPGTDLSSVSITFLAASDNSLTDLKLNGVSTGITQTGFSILTGLFTIDSSVGTFSAGVNTLEWTVFNEPVATPSGFNPHGFRVDQIKGTYNLVPEPGAFLLAALAAVGFMFGRRLG